MRGSNLLYLNTYNTYSSTGVLVWFPSVNPSPIGAGEREGWLARLPVYKDEETPLKVSYLSLSSSESLVNFQRRFSCSDYGPNKI